MSFIYSRTWRKITVDRGREAQATNGLLCYKEPQETNGFLCYKEPQETNGFLCYKEPQANSLRYERWCPIRNLVVLLKDCPNFSFYTDAVATRLKRRSGVSKISKTS